MISAKRTQGNFSSSGEYEVGCRVEGIQKNNKLQKHFFNLFHVRLEPRKLSIPFFLLCTQEAFLLGRVYRTIL